MKEMFKNIIVAVDLSEFSKHVVAQAKAIGHALNTPLKFVFVDHKTDKNQEQLKAIMLDKYQIQDPKDLFILAGDPASEILGFVSQYEKPLVVAGHRSGHSIAELFFGSVAKKLALFSKVPIWIHRSSKTVLPKKIMLPLSLDPCLPRLVKTAEDICSLFQAELEVFHAMRLPTASVDTNSYGMIYEAFKEIDENLIKDFKNEFPHLKVISSDGEPGFEVRERARHCDLVILAPKYRGNKLPFWGTTTTYLVSSGETPLLIFPGMSHKASL